MFCYHEAALLSWSDPQPERFEVEVTNSRRSEYNAVVNREGGGIFGSNLLELFESCNETVHQARAFHQKVVIDLETGLITSQQN